MVIRVYFSDGSFKSIMITSLTTASEACQLFAEKIRLKRFQRNFQLKEITPTTQRMVDQDERPFEIVHRWINQGFKLAMEEKWRFLFTFTEEAQDRLARQTKKILFSQVQSELKQHLQDRSLHSPRTEARPVVLVPTVPLKPLPAIPNDSAQQQQQSQTSPRPTPFSNPLPNRGQLSKKL
jgi:hypothetical protein